MHGWLQAALELRGDVCPGRAVYRLRLRRRCHKHKLLSKRRRKVFSIADLVCRAFQKAFDRRGGIE